MISLDFPIRSHGLLKVKLSIIKVTDDCLIYLNVDPSCCYPSSATRVLFQCGLAIFGLIFKIINKVASFAPSFFLFFLFKDKYLLKYIKYLICEHVEKLWSGVNTM